MSAVGHYLEQNGIATTSISLVREHSEAMRPPRALWVPFALGRPFGAPDAPEFQRRVLLAALRLLEAPSGPVLQDFEEDAPGGVREQGTLSCPVSFERSARPREGELARALLAEVAQLRPWHELARTRRGRSTFGVSGLSVNDAAAFVAAITDSGALEARAIEEGFALRLKRICDDLRAWYEEALAAQPGTPSRETLQDWFWERTAAGSAFFELQRICLQSGDKALQQFGTVQLVPRAVANRRKSQR